MDTAHWPQEMIVKPLEEIVTNTCPKPLTAGGEASGERKARPKKEQAINCPRCNSINTKFCYYNNYSLTQPRYFCKSCRRYWTEGGSLRNIPVGGGSKKNKRSHNNHFDHSTQQPATKKHLSDHQHHLMSMSQQGLTSQTQQDLNLGFSPNGLIRTNFTDLIHNIGNKNNTNGNSSFMGFQVHNNQDGFAMQDHYKPCSTNTTLLGFSLDNHENGFQGPREGGDDVNGRQLFPFEDLKLPVSSSSTSIHVVESNDHQKAGTGDASTTSSAGYWTGMMSGGPW